MATIVSIRGSIEEHTSGMQHNCHKRYGVGGNCGAQLSRHDVLFSEHANVHPQNSPQKAVARNGLTDDRSHLAAKGRSAPHVHRASTALAWPATSPRPPTIPLSTPMLQSERSENRSRPVKSTKQKKSHATSSAQDAKASSTARFSCHLWTTSSY